ncbi:DoxX family protein [Vibrio algarum]|uniref:DoxX family protein n=1 Tax=Vibrio algarum TaxID=3020714 RepID=A0ABT4YPJ6_9VIBR|nr:DoxX family protein [Vibrio sp. KJ40-1]MDB1123423.1 DoxX family protein [Vibrio sp. KJ40-1]
MKELLQLITKPSELMYHDLLLRFFAGITMIYHGQGKLFNLDGTAMFFSKIGIEPAYLMAVIASLGEVLGGIAVAIGLFTRIGALANIVSLTVAVVLLGWPNGFDVRNGGYEYQACLLVVFVFILINGAGKLSADKLIYSKLR